MEHVKSKALSGPVFIPFILLIFIRPFLSGLAYPTAEIFYQNWIMFLAILTLFSYRKLSFKNPYDLPLLFIVMAYFISMTSSINMQNSAKEIVRFISYFSVFFIIFRADERQKDLLVKVIVLSAIIISLYSIYQYFWGYQRTLDYLERINSDFLLNSSYAKDILIAKRAIGTFPSPNILGGYLIIAFFLSLYLFFKKPLFSGLTRKTAICSAILIAFVLILTKSLGAWLSLAATSIILFLRSYKLLRHKRSIMLCFSILMLFIVVFILFNRSDRLVDLNNSQSSITQRLNYWRTAIAIIKNHFFLGAGPGNFQEVFLNYKVGAGTDTRYAHNIFLQQWSETGILGFIGIILLIFTFITKARSKYIFSAGLAFLLHNLIDSTYFVPQVGLFWWVIIGLTSTLDNVQGPHSSSPS